MISAKVYEILSSGSGSLEDKLVKTTSYDAGMIKAIIIPTLMSVVFMVHPRGKIVPVRILHSSHEPVHRQKRQTCCKW